MWLSADQDRRPGLAGCQSAGRLLRRQWRSTMARSLLRIGESSVLSRRRPCGSLIVENNPIRPSNYSLSWAMQAQRLPPGPRCPFPDSPVATTCARRRIPGFAESRQLAHEQPALWRFAFARFRTSATTSTRRPLAGSGQRSALIRVDRCSGPTPLSSVRGSLRQGPRGTGHSLMTSPSCSASLPDALLRLRLRSLEGPPFCGGEAGA